MQEIFTEETQAWKFNEYRWYFKFNVGIPSIYIFTSRESPYAMCAIPLTDREPTLENAQAATREWILEHNDGYDFAYLEGKRKYRSVANPPDPGFMREAAAPDDYEGDRCDLCGKKDDGDLVPSPADPDKHRCMICYVGGAGQ